MSGAMRRRLQTWAVPILLAVSWELLTRAGVLDTRFFIPLTEVAASIVTLFTDGRLSSDLLATIRRLLAAFGIAAVAGTAIGIASALWRGVALLVRPIADTIYPTPKIALLPLLIIIVGLGETAWIITAFATAFFQIIISTSASVKDIDPQLIEAGRNFGATGLRFFRRLLLPAMAPGLLNGLRLGMATCLITLVVVEFVSAESGLGSIIYRAGQQFAVDEIYAGIVLTGLLGHGINLAFRGLERVLLPWQTHQSTSTVATGG
ncbi:ABC transporter permease [Egicoccus sp. AB-alg2]|uniref:ABC transporter permease n=1 Tax=Egicoccus sp. AB-alg2 TaxID=3242693 RepID=UPI00359D0E17